MKISELIKILQEKQGIHGDIDVSVDEYPNDCSLVDVTQVYIDKNGKLHIG